MNSKIVNIGSGKPVVGIVGICHGDEICGRKVLDELKIIKPKSKLKLIYANLAAEKAGKRFIDSNLNRVFPGKADGNLEEKTAYQLRNELAECDYVLDIHSTSYASTPFAISTVDLKDFDILASYTGLSKSVIMVNKLADGKSLIDFVNSNNGKGISFEAGTHLDDSSFTVAMNVVMNFLINIGVIEGVAENSKPDKFYGVDVIKVPSDTFKPYLLENFELLPKGNAYGQDEIREYYLDYDCYPFLFSDKLIDEKVFLTSVKDIGEYRRLGYNEQG